MESETELLLDKVKATKSSPVFDLMESLILSIEKDAPDGLMIGVWERINFLKENIDNLRDLFDVACLMWIKANNRSLMLGTIEKYVGPTKKEECLSIRKALEAIAELSGEKVPANALDIIADAMSKNGLKPGHCKKLLGDDYKKYFETTYKDAIHTKGEGRRPPIQDEHGNVVKTIDLNYVD